MSLTIFAIYESGVFRPLGPVELPDCARVELTIDSDAALNWLDREAHAVAELGGDASISLEAVRRQLATIPGSLADDVIADRGEY